jgi:hypothetical protein
MKKLYASLLLLFIIVAALTEQGCDILNNLFLNQALKQPIKTSGDTNPIYNSETFCLSKYDAIDDNIDNIIAITYVSAAYFTESYLPSDLGATDIKVTLKAEDGTVIFVASIPNASASNYVKNPYEIELSANEIALFNQYLADYENSDCYTAELSLNATGSSTPYSLTGRIEIVVQMEIKP